MENFAGKVAFVTGGASGIGLGMARNFLAEGMKVVIADYNQDHLDQAREILKGNNASHLIRVDVSDRAGLRAAAQAFTDNDWDPADEAWAAMNARNSRWYVRVAPDGRTPGRWMPWASPVRSSIAGSGWASRSCRASCALTARRCGSSRAPRADCSSRCGSRGPGERRHPPLPGTGSHLVGVLAQANALIIVGEDQTALNMGDTVRTLVLDRPY